jgi:hypothetical protein
MQDRRKDYRKGKKLKSTSSLTYLGIAQQTIGTVFSIHVTKQCIAAIKAMNSIVKLEELSLNITFGGL